VKRRNLLALLVVGSTAAAYGCTSILGLGDYKIGTDAAAADAHVDGLAEASGCDAESVLNACTESACVPYDDKEHIKHPDFTNETNLPQVPDLPPVDSGGGG
jgi:hypothetical protein